MDERGVDELWEQMLRRTEVELAELRDVCVEVSDKLALLATRGDPSPDALRLAAGRLWAAAHGLGDLDSQEVRR